MTNNAAIQFDLNGIDECFSTDPTRFSETRDIFNARLQSYLFETNKYLESAIIGEIGNNTFDHNFVFKENYPRGVYFNPSYGDTYVVLADYGRGIKESLSDILPAIKTDLELVKSLKIVYLLDRLRFLFRGAWLF